MLMLDPPDSIAISIKNGVMGAYWRACFGWISIGHIMQPSVESPIASMVDGSADNLARWRRSSTLRSFPGGRPNHCIWPVKRRYPDGIAGIHCQVPSIKTVCNCRVCQGDAADSCCRRQYGIINRSLLGSCRYPNHHCEPDCHEKPCGKNLPADSILHPAMSAQVG